MAGSGALLTLATMAVLLVGLAVAPSPAHTPSKSPSPKASPSPSPTAVTTPPASAPSPHDPAAFPPSPPSAPPTPTSEAPVTRLTSLALDKTGGCWSRPTEAAAPGSEAGDRMPPLASPITIITPVTACVLIIAGSVPYILTFLIVVNPRTLAVSEKLRHPFLARLDSLDKSDEIQLKSCKFRYSTSEESTQRERN
ncbi:hypothetical protein NL676_030636 [Syzygium grande]|nr:hypothetical protein NL676_030636 [Syzygium grande]